MNSAWQQAVDSGDIEAVRQLLDEGADIDQRDRYGQTALIRAIYHRAPIELFNLLMERGADVNATTKGRMTALMLSILWERTDVARLLIEAGADVHAKSSRHHFSEIKTALKLAEERDYQDIVRLLKQAGAKE